jgi:hypothetical protein
MKKHTTKFENEYIPNYAVETLINGNISECVDYLKRIKATSIAGDQVAHEELMAIKEQVPEKYNYIKSKVFSLSLIMVTVLCIGFISCTSTKNGCGSYSNWESKHSFKQR